MTKAERSLGSTWLRRPGDRRAPGWRKLTNAERLQCNGRPGSVRSRLRMVIEAIGGMQLPLVGALVAAGLKMVAMNPRDFEGTWQASKDRSPRNTGLDQLRREARAQGSALRRLRVTRRRGRPGLRASGVARIGVAEQDPEGVLVAGVLQDRVGAGVAQGVV